PVNLKPLRSIKALSPVRLPLFLNRGRDIIGEKKICPRQTIFRNFVAFSRNTTVGKPTGRALRLEHQETDERLLENAAKGETKAFQVLYERYRDPIFRFAYRLLGSAEAAEDVTHDCFLSLITEPSRFDATRASLRTYLYAAARNQAAKRYQAFGRESALEELTAEPRSPDHHQ